MTVALEPASGPTRPSADGTREWTASFNVLQSLLEQDQAELHREVLLWQRWVRYGAAALLCAVGLVVQAHYDASLELRLAFGGVVALYCLGIAGASWTLARGRGRPLPPAVPLVTILGDLAAIAVGAHLALPPTHLGMVLIAGFLVLQLAAFYFGQRVGYVAAVGTAAIYAVEALVVPPRIPGPSLGTAPVMASLVAWIFVSGVLVGIFGSFRRRMNLLRQYCKRVEVGDLATAFDAEQEARPDDLTLLARSVDAMRQRLIELVGTDPLTGALNRRALETRLRREWRSARRRGSMLAVLAVDLDNFKPINDTWGHPAGDAVLRELCDVMRLTARDTDVIARVGGDEFVLILPDTGWQGAITFAERLRRQVDEAKFAGEQQIPVTISIGISLARGTDDVKATDLLEEADRSLYRAKTGGRNRVGA